jgi:putative photosynthetic complex assembly protein 2
MDFLLPAGFTVFTWWLATLLLMRFSIRARPRCRITLAALSVMALAGLLGLVWTRADATVAGAYLGFISGLAVWAWLEMSYFLGFVTGPRPLACPPGLPPAQRFRYGVLASLYHELSIVAVALLITGLQFEAANPVGCWTYLLLWWMRWSAKLNIFLGVRNLHMNFWPDHLQYLASYVGPARFNWLFPLTMVVAGVVAVWLVYSAVVAAPQSFERTAAVLLASLLVLAMLEHVFLVVRLPDASLWHWADSSGASPRPGLSTGPES